MERKNGASLVADQRGRQSLERESFRERERERERERDDRVLGLSSSKQTQCQEFPGPPFLYLYFTVLSIFFFFANLYLLQIYLFLLILICDLILCMPRMTWQRELKKEADWRTSPFQKTFRVASVWVRPSPTWQALDWWVKRTYRGLLDFSLKQK
jgi:Flp pilus assembly protein TadB